MKKFSPILISVVMLVLGLEVGQLSAGSPEPPGGTRDWGTALGDIDSLNSSGTMSGTNCLDTSKGGTHQTDWVFPNVEELQSLVDYGFSLPALSNGAGTGKWTAGDPFLNVQGMS